MESFDNEELKVKKDFDRPKLIRHRVCNSFDSAFCCIFPQNKKAGLLSLQHARLQEGSAPATGEAATFTFVGG